MERTVAEARRHEEEIGGWLSTNGFKMTAEQHHPSYDVYENAKFGFRIHWHDDGGWKLFREEFEPYSGGEGATELKASFERLMDIISSAAPKSRSALLAIVRDHLTELYEHNPVVEIQKPNSGEFRVRVGQQSGMPRYFRIRVTEER